jgi:hypothetical protein
MPTNQTDIEAVALLDEPARRARYDGVVGAARPLSRDEATRLLCESRHEADKLRLAGPIRSRVRPDSNR